MTFGWPSRPAFKPCSMPCMQLPRVAASSGYVFVCHHDCCSRWHLPAPAPLRPHQLRRLRPAPRVQAQPNSDLWTTIVPLPVGSEVQYKHVVLGPEGGYRGACYEMMPLPPASSEWNLKVAALMLTPACMQTDANVVHSQQCSGQ